MKIITTFMIVALVASVLILSNEIQQLKDSRAGMMSVLLCMNEVEEYDRPCLSKVDYD